MTWRRGMNRKAHGMVGWERGLKFFGLETLKRKLRMRKFKGFGRFEHLGYCFFTQLGSGIGVSNLHPDTSMGFD